MTGNYRVDSWERAIDKIAFRENRLEEKATQLWEDMEAEERLEDWEDNYDRFEETYKNNQWDDDDEISS